MGRCYEFGVVVGEGCDHAMVVPAGGGRCQCATCGVACTGKFTACAAIIDQPGHVPSTAPAWAVAVGGPRPEPAPPPLPAGPAPRPAPELTELVEAVAKQIAEHDVELVNRIDDLAARVAELQRQGAQQAASLQAALARLADVVERVVETPRPAPLFGFPRRQ